MNLPTPPSSTVLDSPHAVAVSEREFESEVMQATMPVLVDFWASWCSPCEAVAPVLEGIAEEYAGKLVVAKVNTDVNPGRTRGHRVHGIPTLILFNNGAEVDRMVGALPERQMKRWIDDHLAELETADEQ